MRTSSNVSNNNKLQQAVVGEMSDSLGTVRGNCLKLWRNYASLRVRIGRVFHCIIHSFSNYRRSRRGTIHSLFSWGKNVRRQEFAYVMRHREGEGNYDSRDAVPRAIEFRCSKKDVPPRK